MADVERLPLGIVSFVALTVGLGCSSSAAPTTDGTDAGLADAGDPYDGAYGSPCGPAPHVNVELQMRGVTANGEYPIAEAALTSPSCPGLTRTSDETGTLLARVAQGVPFYGRIEAKSQMRMLTPEENFDRDATGPSAIKVVMLPSLFAGLVPNFGADKTAIFLQVTKGKGATGSCASPAGIRLSVDGHPEASVIYYSNDTIPQATTGTVTTVSGRVGITGLAPDQFVALVGDKTGCKVSFHDDFATGRVPLEAGYVTLVPGSVGNP